MQKHLIILFLTTVMCNIAVIGDDNVSNSKHPIPVPSRFDDFTRWELIWYMSNSISKQKIIAANAEFDHRRFYWANESLELDLLRKRQSQAKDSSPYLIVGGPNANELLTEDDKNKITEVQNEINRLQKIADSENLKLNKLNDFLELYISACNQDKEIIKDDPYSFADLEGSEIIQFFPKEINVLEVKKSLKDKLKELFERDRNLRRMKSVSNSPKEDKFIEASSKFLLNIKRKLEFYKREPTLLQEYQIEKEKIKSRYEEHDSLLIVSLNDHLESFTVRMPATPVHKNAYTKLCILLYGVGCKYDQENNQWSLVIQKPSLKFDIIQCENVLDAMVKYAESLDFKPERVEFPFDNP